MPLTVSRHRNSGAFWFSVCILVFAAFASASFAVGAAQDLMAGT